MKKIFTVLITILSFGTFGQVTDSIELFRGFLLDDGIIIHELELEIMNRGTVKVKCQGYIDYDTTHILRLHLDSTFNLPSYSSDYEVVYTLEYTSLSKYYHKVTIDGSVAYDYCNGGAHSSSSIFRNYFNIDSVQKATLNPCHGSVNNTESIRIKVWIRFKTSGVSVDEYNSMNTEIYPNPATNDINFTDQELNGSTCQIFDMSGAKVLETTIAKGRVDISSLKESMYFLKITDDGKIYQSRLYKK